MNDSLTIETRGLTRRFASCTAVDRLDLRVSRGTVYAFLGPNGAGKTTTIRLLCGLLKPDGGGIFIEGQAFTPKNRALLRGIGAVVEGPSFYPHLTGEENLRVTCRLRGLSLSRIPEVLGLLGLTDDARTVVRAYSTGMRQRLTLALALLSKPQLLILDEPANGLDPSGIRALRLLLKRLAHEEGGTVFVSSHALTEVEQVADEVGIINRGRLRYQGPLRGLPGYGQATLEDIFLNLVAESEGKTA